jgi:hypothetical protein
MRSFDDRGEKETGRLVQAVITEGFPRPGALHRIQDLSRITFSETRTIDREQHG